MRKITLFLFALCLLVGVNTLYAQLPKYDHVIIVMEENYSYVQIIGTTNAPVLTALSKTKYTANFTNSYGNTHPSEPNYLELFSGSNQGVTTDIVGPASGAPFNDCNMGSSLIAAGYSFIGYAESQPSVGWTSGTSGNYYTKHCPWINWMVGATSDSIPVNSDLPFSSFPDSLHYSKLPTVSWVIPNIVDDMHNPTGSSTAIQNGDAWFKKNIMPLVRWAVTHNTLVITTWDEDDNLHSNNIATLFSGSNINGGTYSTPTFTHYDVLRTIEDMYGLPYCGSSSTAADITGMWNITTGITAEPTITNNVAIWPVPAKSQLNMKISVSTADKVHINICDITGRVIKEENADLKSGDNAIDLNIEGFANGIYFVNVNSTSLNVCKKFVVQN
jgi:hypothetical protein